MFSSIRALILFGLVLAVAAAMYPDELIRAVGVGFLAVGFALMASKAFPLTTLPKSTFLVTRCTGYSTYDKLKRWPYHLDVTCDGVHFPVHVVCCEPLQVGDRVELGMKRCATYFSYGAERTLPLYYHVARPKANPAPRRTLSLNFASE